MKKLLSLVLFCAALLVAAQQISLGSLFQDGAVFQRNVDIPVWGKTDPGLVLLAEFAGQKVRTKSNTAGEFMFRFAPVPAGGPYVLNVTDKDGKILGTSFKATKRELKEQYGMAAAVNYGMDWNGDGVVKEWFEQSAAFSKHVVGMTADQVKAMGTKTVEGKGYVISNDADLLAAGCTIQITSIKAVVAESVTNAR